MKNFYCFLLSLFLFFPCFSYAIFCPTNFSQISIGDTKEKILQQCGKPASEETKDQPLPVAQEWSYFIKEAVSTGGMSTTQGTLKTQFVFDSEGRAINISVNGIGVGSTTICGGKLIQLGDREETVKAACGEPVLRDKQESDPSKATKVTTMTYDTQPPVTLIFENGKLKEKQ